MPDLMIEERERALAGGISSLFATSTKKEIYTNVSQKVCVREGERDTVCLCVSVSSGPVCMCACVCAYSSTCVR